MGLFCAGDTLKKLAQDGSAVTIDLRSWNRLTQLKLSLDPGQTVKQTTHASPQETSPVLLPAKVFQKHQTYLRALKKKRSVALKKPEQDVLSTALAAPIRQVLEPGADDQELTKMRELHEALRSQFFVAMKRVAPSVTTQIVQVMDDSNDQVIQEVAVNTQDVEENTPAEAKENGLSSQKKENAPLVKDTSHPPKLSPSEWLGQQSPFNEIQASRQAGGGDLGVLWTAFSLPRGKVEFIAKTEEKPPLTTALLNAPIERELPDSVSEIPRTKAAKEIVERPPATSEVTDSITTYQSAPEEMDSQSLDLGSKLSAWVASAKIDYSKVSTLFSLSSNRTRGNVTIQVPTQKRGPEPKPQTVDKPNYLKKTDSSPQPEPASEPNPLPPAPDGGRKVNNLLSAAPKTCSEVTRNKFVEAFNWEREIFSVKVEEITKDYKLPAECEAPSWKIVKAESYWPTFLRAPQEQIPLINLNAVQMLAMVNGTTVQSDAGIVFGKVPSGWTVEFSGRSERILILNSENRPVPSEDLRGERSFIFLNAAPGAHLLRAVWRSGILHQTGAVGIPVQSGVATYVDLTPIQKVTLRGKVVDASSGNAPGLGRVTVRVVGQEASAFTVSRIDGSYELDHVIALPSHPIFMETDAAVGYTHRYQIRAEKKENILYRLSEHQIKQWQEQLVGGISSEGGIIAGAFGDVVASAGEDRALIPNTFSLLNTGTLLPETYAVSGNGQILPNMPLDQNSPRFLAVHVPEGPVIAQLSDRGQRRVWSELIISSPNVISLIGPY